MMNRRVVSLLTIIGGDINGNGLVRGRRGIGHAIFPCTRMPLLEELFELPVLRQGELDHDTSVALKNYTPPTLLHQIEASLSNEFKRHITKTNWSDYKDPIEEFQYEQAARLLHYTLASVRRACAKYPTAPSPPPKNISSNNIKWLRQECDLLLVEIRTGKTDRWEDARKLIGPKWRTFGEERQNALLPAILLVSNNPYMHPFTKRRILEEITNVIIKTVK